MMNNPFQIGEDVDLSFGDEDFLLDSIDLEAIAAKALQTKPSADQSPCVTAPTADSISLQQRVHTNQSVNTSHKQFQPFDGLNSAANGQNRNAAQASTVSTPQNRAKKFSFKSKKSPDIAQGGVSFNRSVLSSDRNSPHTDLKSVYNRDVSPVVERAALHAPTNGKVILGARNPGADVPSGSLRFKRSPQPQTSTVDVNSKVAQPPMGVTVKRDGTCISTKPSQPTFNPQSNKGPFNLRTPSAQEMQQVHVDRNVLPSNSSYQPGQQPSPAKGKVFQKFVAPPSDTTNSGTHTLRTSQSMNRMSNTSSIQLRNLSVNSNLSSNSPSQSMNSSSSLNPSSQSMNSSSSLNPPKNSFTAVNHMTSTPPSPVEVRSSATSQTSLRSRTGASSTPCNQPQQPFKRYQPMTNVQNSTPKPNSQFQGGSASPMQASTPGYRTPSGGPSPGSGRYKGVTTPMQPMGQASRYPATPRAGGSTFSTTDGTPRMRGVGNRPGNSQQVPMLTPRVAQLCQTPSGNGSKSTMRTRARKFPGPAGVLPKLKPGQKLDDAVVEELPSTSKKKPEPSLDDSLTSMCSQDSVDEFQRGAWLTMKRELGRSASSILSSYNIAIVLRKASLKQLPRKQVPNLCVMIRQITQTGFDACVMLKDPSGEMQGTLHRKIVEDYQTDLKPGSVLVLRKVGVLSPSIRNHYLNITPSNLVQVYTPESASRPCSQTSPKSEGTNSSISRSPKNIDDHEEDSDFTSTKDSSRNDPQHSSYHSNKPMSPLVGNDKQGHPRSKILLIEGVNTPERNHRTSSITNQQLNNNMEMPDILNKVHKGKTLSIEGVEGNQVHKSPPHAEDSGISLDVSSGDISLPVQKTKHRGEHMKSDDASNSMSWLRKRHTDTDMAETSTDGRINNCLPPKRRCLEINTKSDLSVTRPSLSMTKSQTDSGQTEIGSVMHNAKPEHVKVAEENFASLLEGIEDEFFDDF